MTARKPSRPPLAPSDVLGRMRGASVLRVAGRVLATSASELVIGDAFASLTVRGAALAAAPGDLLLVSGRWDGRALAATRVLERWPCPTTTGSGEFARLSFHGVGPRLAARARAFTAFREYFASEGFVEVDPPLRVRAPGVDMNIEALRADGGYLITSPELGLKRLLVGGVPRCFSLSHVFRAEEQGHLHEPEFCLLEWYRAFAGQSDVQLDTERLVVAVAKAVRGKAELIAPGGRKLSLRTPFPRLGVPEAFARYAGVKDVVTLCAEDEQRYFELFVDRVEPALAKLDRPVFVVDYPLSQAALARPSPADPRLAERFELYAGGVELCNGYGELTDPAEQRRRFEHERTTRRRLRRKVYPLDRQFLLALSEGMPPSGGNALGVDRLVMLATGARCIQDVLPLPWERL